MVKHIILWKLKTEFNTDEIKADMKNTLESLVGVVPGLIELKLQTEKLSTSSADVMLYSVFESPEALAVYAKHPEHVKAADTKVRPFVETRLALDFEE